MPQTTIIETCPIIRIEQQLGAEVIWREIEVCGSGSTNRLVLRLFDEQGRPLDLSGKEITFNAAIAMQDFSYTAEITGNEAVVDFSFVISADTMGKYTIYVHDTQTSEYYVAAQGIMWVINPLVDYT